MWNFSALRIHVSDDARQILDKFGTFELELRGEVELKGKGRVTTHWLLGCSEPDPRPPTPQPCSGTAEASPYPLLFPTNSCTKVST
jgi:atrial natriuretic peptide receptor A